MHVASALGVPTVAVFGATDDTTTGPTGPLARVVREHAECSPCLLRECPIDHRCMTRVTAARVAEVALELWEESAARMDTRNKILSLDDALARRWPRLVVVAGYFDVLRAADARELEAIRQRTGAGAACWRWCCPLEDEILPQRARAEMAAALRVIDYVVIADHSELDRLVACSSPWRRSAWKRPKPAARAS